jgi:hypothetical protein
MADPGLEPTEKQNVSPGPSQQIGGRWIVVAVGLPLSPSVVWLLR